jgi:hypothetical protein
MSALSDIHSSPPAPLTWLKARIQSVAGYADRQEGKLTGKKQFVTAKAQSSQRNQGLIIRP